MVQVSVLEAWQDPEELPLPAAHSPLPGLSTQGGSCLCSASPQLWLRGDQRALRLWRQRALGEVASATIHEPGLGTAFSHLGQLNG